MYAKGQGPLKGPQESARCHIKAAQADIPQTKRRLAMVYLLGRCVPRNIPWGVNWLAKWAAWTFFANDGFAWPDIMPRGREP